MAVVYPGAGSAEDATLGNRPEAMPGVVPSTFRPARRSLLGDLRRAVLEQQEQDLAVAHEGVVGSYPALGGAPARERHTLQLAEAAKQRTSLAAQDPLLV